ncbi:MAG: hypothetical protein EOP84_04635 [Verrucomicrobiaceae bacterium]|nr:MAG: hypothetical protein EOP84_04635 [Verrucomicrobiaceae bacterium]
MTIIPQIGKMYQIQWSEDLSEWTTLPEVIVGAGQEITRFYSTKEYPKVRYFRAAALPTPQP